MPAFIPSARVSDTPEAREDKLRQLLDMAFWHSDAGNADSAILACRAALEIDGACVSALSLLGCLYEKKGEIDLAIEAFERAVDLNPNSVADIEKLEMLRAGVTHASIAPPRAYRWIPPAVAHYFVGNKRAPMIVAGAAGVVVILIGISGLNAIVASMKRPIEPAPSRVATLPTPSAPTLATPKTDARPAPVLQVQNPTPTVAPPPTTSPVYSPPPGQAGGFVSALEVARLRRNALDRATPVASSPIRPLPKPGAREAALPSVKSVKPLDTPSRPSATATDAGLPTHTVVISAPQSAATVVEVVPQPSAPPPPSPRISIRFLGPNGAGDDVPSDNSASRSRSSDSHRGTDLQKRAISLQNQGNYDQAIATYRSAISAYQSDVASGRNADMAKRGIDACETGIQICKQSQ